MSDKKTALAAQTVGLLRKELGELSDEDLRKSWREEHTFQVISSDSSFSFYPGSDFDLVRNPPRGLEVNECLRALGRIVAALAELEERRAAT